MSEFTYLFKSFIEKGTLSGSRSTVLQPFNWIITAIIIGLGICLKFKSPIWVLGGLFVAFLLIIGCFIYAYVYCLYKDRNALRSEKYNIIKNDKKL